MVELYINNKKVDLNDSISLGMTYSQLEIYNPTAIKNPYSVSIAIPRTDNNNKIFDDIYRLDRQQTEQTFNPSKRVDFIILSNGCLFERGYMQLTSITNQSYNINLYGLLGDFFYKLKYNNDGTTRTLADIKFTADDEDYFKFNINKEWVYESFNGSEEGLHSLLKFIPAYNGLYDEFDTASCLVNQYDTSFPRTNGEYGLYNGYGLAKLNESYTEWEIRDLRSYKQRPALRLKELFKAILNKDNTGYQVNLDPTWFSPKNPYWEQSYITLPLLGADQENESMAVDDSVTGDQINISNNNPSNLLNLSTTTIPITDGYIDLSSYSDDTTIDMTIPYDLKFNKTSSVTTGPEIYMSRRGYFDESVYPPVYYAEGSCLLVQLLVKNEAGKIVGYSNVQFITNYTDSTYELNIDHLKDYTPATSAPVDYIRKAFKENDAGEYWIKDRIISINNLIKPASKIKVELSVSAYSTNDTKLNFYNGVIYDSTPLQGNVDVIINTNNTFTLKTDYKIGTNTLITKKKLLTTEDSAADYLISYAKLFGLYFEIDKINNEINIKSRNSFFKRNVIDITGKIDYSKEITIEPLLFDKKWYLMKLETPETYYASKYKNRYNIEYGQQRIDTGYEFNSDVNELLSDNVFQQVITARDSSKYYRSYFNGYKEQPCFLVDNCDWVLYKTKDDSTTQTLYGSQYITRISDWGLLAGQDSNYKLCYFDKNKSTSDFAASLVFYNGYFDTPQIYWLTDDVQEMFELNEDRCYLYTKNEYNTAGERIAYKLTSIPSYSSYLINNNQVTDSFDLGWPKEWFIPGVSYTDDKCIYSRFNKAYYNDLFNVNTRKLTCWALLDEIDLRSFYLINNTLYILNKANDYSAESKQPQQFEFIRVNDINAYTNGQIDYTYGFTLSTLQAEYNGDYSATLTAADSWTVETSDPSQYQFEQTSGDAGTTLVECRLNLNDTWHSEIFYATFTSKLNEYSQTFKIEQLPNLSKARNIYVTENVLTLDSMKVNVVSNTDRYTYPFDSDNKSWLIYGPKNEAFEIQLINRKGLMIRRFQITAGTDDIPLSL